MNSRVARVLLAVFAVPTVAWLIIGGVLSAKARARLRQVKDERSREYVGRQEQIDMLLRRVAPLISTRSSGGSATELVTRRGTATLDLPYWLDHVDDPAVTSIDLSWMASLEHYAFIDSWTDPGSLAKVRLLQGIHDDTLPVAAREVRQLASLLVASGTTEGLSLARDLWEFEDRAHQRAVELGRNVEGMKPIDESARHSILMVIGSTRLSRSIFTGPPFSRVELGPLRCVTLRIGLEEAVRFERLLRPSLRERYLELEQELAESSCRFTLAQLRERQERKNDAPAWRPLREMARDYDLPMGWLMEEVRLDWLPLAKLPAGVDASIGWGP